MKTSPVSFSPTDITADSVDVLSNVSEHAKNQLRAGSQKKMYASGNSNFLEQHYTGADCGIIQLDFYQKSPRLWKINLKEKHLALIYVMAGNLALQVNLQPSFVLKEGFCFAASLSDRYIIVHFDQPHTQLVYIYYGSKYLDHLAFINNYFVLFQKSIDTAGRGFRLFSAVRIPPEFYLQLNLVTGYTGNGTRFSIYLRARTLDILLNYLDSIGSRQENTSTSKTEQIYRLKLLIDKHEGRPLRIADLCNKSGLSRAALQKGFRQLLGLTANQYQLKVRLEKSAELLVNNPSLSVYATGLKAGFEEESSYIKAFKSRFGITPLQYRKKYR